MSRTCGACRDLDLNRLRPFSSYFEQASCPLWPQPCRLRPLPPCGLGGRRLGALRLYRSLTGERRIAEGLSVELARFLSVELLSFRGASPLRGLYETSQFLAASQASQEM